jgi:hypothetical protein
MKLEIKINASGKPAIFWLDNPKDRPHEITCHTADDASGTACRAYMRKCEPATSPAHVDAAIELLFGWTRHMKTAMK